MELRHLRYLAAVADAGNFGRAAARLGITQPPLSRQIQILERELGIALLTRTGRRVRPTAAGERFLAEARDILAAAERAADTARRSSPAVSGTIAVGTLQTSLLSVLFRVLPEFRNRHPEVVVRLRTLPNSLQAAALRAGDLDVGFLFLPYRTRDLFVRPLLSDPILVALPEGHPLAKVGKVPIGALEGRELILFPRRLAPAYHDFVLDLLRRRRVSMRVAAEADSYLTALGLVAAGSGLALLPSTLRQVQYPGVTYRETSPLLGSAGLGLVRRSEAPGPVLAAFLDVVDELFPSRASRVKRGGRTA